MSPASTVFIIFFALAIVQVVRIFCYRHNGQRFQGTRGVLQVEKRFSDRNGIGSNLNPKQKKTVVSHVSMAPQLLLGHGTYILTKDNGVRQQNNMQYWSQYKQDAFVDKLLKNKKGGFFLEIGGYDGEKHSNTLFFEKFRGWNGVLVEANPFTFRQMVKKDRKCYMTNACISRTMPNMTFAIAGGLTTWVDTINEAKQERIKEDKRTYGSAVSWEGAGETVTTKCSTVKHIVDEIGVSTIDYFSLDVEGAEMLILESLDFNDLTIKVFSIEVQENGKEIHTFMTTHGYERVGTVAIDYIYQLKGETATKKS
jgi:hypothetical protein